MKSENEKKDRRTAEEDEVLPGTWLVALAVRSLSSSINNNESRKKVNLLNESKANLVNERK